MTQLNRHAAKRSVWRVDEVQDDRDDICGSVRIAQRRQSSDRCRSVGGRVDAARHVRAGRSCID